MKTPGTEWAAFVLAVVLTSPLVWWSLDRRPPVEIIGYDLVPAEVKPGQTLYRVITVNRTRVCVTDPDIVIVDAERVRWRIDEPQLVAPGPLGKETYKVPFVIPRGIAIGPAELRVTLTRKCNPMHEFWPLIEVTPTQYFTVSSPVDKLGGQTPQQALTYQPGP